MGGCEDVVGHEGGGELAEIGQSIARGRVRIEYPSAVFGEIDDDAFVAVEGDRDRIELYGSVAVEKPSRLARIVPSAADPASDEHQVAFGAREHGTIPIHDLDACAASDQDIAGVQIRMA